MLFLTTKTCDHVLRVNLDHLNIQGLSKLTKIKVKIIKKRLETCYFVIKNINNVVQMVSRKKKTKLIKNQFSNIVI